MKLSRILTNSGFYSRFDGMQVLIIDDQFTGRKIVEGLVRAIEPKLVIYSHEDAFQALVSAKEHKPDLVLTDYRMPKMDGIEFSRRLRSLPNCVDVPLVMITADNDLKIRYDALEAGATDFLTRPIDQIEFRARCRNLLTLRKQQQIIKSRSKWLEERVADATHEIRMRERETLLRLAKAGEYRDEDTGAHVLRMAKYSHLLAERLGLPKDQCAAIELAAPMHDIGKVGIPDHILLKPGQLTDEEWHIMRQHPNIGQAILQDSPSEFISLGATIALGHHERFDGTGYPRGLAGEQIPIEARIVAVADVYDALTSYRPYKPAWKASAAKAHIIEQSGRHFDPRCVTSFMDLFDQVREIQAFHNENDQAVK